MDSGSSRHRSWLLICSVLAVFAYLPALNNGFIADDYAILKRVEILKTQPLYLYQVPPENFRLMSYVVFGAVKAVAGYHAWPFYAFNIGLHLVNLVLLFRLLRVLLQDDAVVRLAVLFFAVFQAPQEAIMWLAAMNETTMFFFTVVALLAWWRKQFAASALAYGFALFSKESAVIVPVLIVLMDLYKEKVFVWRRYLVLLIPTAVFAVIFLLTLSNNFMLTNRSYSFGPQALLVVGKSLHRLLWPWFYVFVAMGWLARRRLPSLREVFVYLAAVVVVMLPYMFIAYQTSLPSRQLYLACAILMTLFATLLKPLRETRLLSFAVITFVAFNIGYLWLRKDRQFEERAAPTSRLIETLRQYRPQTAIITNFAYPYPEIASSAALAVPGWAGLVTVAEAGNCTHCLQLEWDSTTLRYRAVQVP